VSHIFPPRVPYDKDKLAPEDLNVSLRHLEAKLADGLGEQDIEAGAATGLEVVRDALLTAAASQTFVSMDISGTEQWPLFGQTDSIEVEDFDAWQVLESITTNTGNDLLYIVGGAQLVGFKIDGSNDTPSDKPYRVQVCLYVDDVLLETVSGQVYPDPPVRMIDKGTASSATADWDFRHQRYVMHGWGLGNHLQPVRCVAVVPVLAGAHTVELRARRLPRIDGELDDDPHRSAVVAYNRQLGFLRARDYQVGGFGGSDMALSPVTPGVLAASKLNTPLSQAAAELNNPPQRAIRSGALRAEHLATQAPLFAVKNFSSGTPVSQTIAAYTGPHNTAGNPVVDGSGATLTLGAFDFRARGHGVVLVLANVSVWRIQWGASSEDTHSAVFKLVYVNDAGTDVVVAVAERHLTPRARVPDGAGGGHLYSPQATYPENVPCEDDVPLFWWADTQALEDLDFDDGKWDSVRVDVEGWGPGGVAPTVIQTNRAHLSVTFYAGASLA
jgi:hypothetical protein